MVGYPRFKTENNLDPCVGKFIKELHASFNLASANHSIAFVAFTYVMHRILSDCQLLGRYAQGASEPLFRLDYISKDQIWMTQVVKVEDSVCGV